MPYAVASLADLPGSLQQAARQSVGSAIKPSLICVFPSRTRLKIRPVGNTWMSRPCYSRKRVSSRYRFLIRQSGCPDNVFAAADLLYARLSLILMYGRLELVDDHLTRVVVEFNAAGFDMIKPGLQQLLGTCAGRMNPSTRNAAGAKTVLGELGERSFKFKNGLYLYGLLPDEQVLGFVFQPALWGRRWHFLPLKIAETTLLALTDQQLIIVEEQSRSRFPAYGWIFTFYPRQAIGQAGMAPNQRGQEWCIGLKSKAALVERRILLESLNGSAWQELWSRCQ